MLSLYAILGLSSNPLENRKIFDLIIVIDWSASSRPGPVNPAPDRCWIAWAPADQDYQTEYFRTRQSCMARLEELTRETTGPILLAFDFPFGYPHGSGLKGGREVAERLSRNLTDNDKDANNRFDLANLLNGEISNLPGPFWGHPKSQKHENLTWQKPPFDHTHFNEWRLSEKHLKSTGHKIMNVWQLLGQGSVGSQTLTGLARLYEFSQIADFKDKVRFWPFDTHWDQQLDGIILAEVWPSLNEYSDLDHPIKDARQVVACLEWLRTKNRTNDIRELFAAPACLTPQQQDMCKDEEGWILGVT